MFHDVNMNLGCKTWANFIPKPNFKRTNLENMALFENASRESSMSYKPRQLWSPTASGFDASSCAREDHHRCVERGYAWHGHLCV